MFTLAALLGCGGGPRTHPVHGTVQFPDGKPLPGGRVEFEAVDPAVGKINASGNIDANGRFSLTTFKKDDGAVGGEHRALVIPPTIADEDLAKGAKPWFDPKFRRYESSGLKFTVTPGDNEIKITVKK
jgi:hypothetical protein